MGTMLGNYGMSVNTGTYFGNGYSNVSGRNNGSSYTKVASSTNLNRIARDLTQGYSRNMNIISKYIDQGNIDQALTSYNSLLETVKATANSYGYELTDEQIASQLDDAYLRATGINFTDAIEEKSHSPFVTGLIESIPIVGLFANGNSNAEALSKLDGTETRALDKFAETAGSVTPGALTAAAGTVGMLAFGLSNPVGWAMIGIGTACAIAGYIKNQAKN